MQTVLERPETPDRCELQHKVFTTLGDVRFRRSSTDGETMIALRLGDKEAQLPIESLRREFSIGKDTADGRMLDLIGSALDYVSSLQPGDRLPPEVCSGLASWAPGSKHIRMAGTRLRLDLVSWGDPKSARASVARDEATLLFMSDDPTLYSDVHLVSIAVADRLGLADGQQVVALLDECAQELAYIEALRERLLGRVAALCRRVGLIQRDGKRPGMSFDTLSQVHRLLMIATKQMVGRFDEVDAQTGEIGSLLRNMDNQRVFIRANRDWLYRCLRTWEPILDRWSRLADDGGDEMGPVLSASYQFLAPRYMPSTAWHGTREKRGTGPVPSPMRW